MFLFIFIAIALLIVIVNDAEKKRKPSPPPKSPTKITEPDKHKISPTPLYTSTIAKSGLDMIGLPLSRRRQIANLADYVVIDTETTGLYPYSDRICEIALIRVSGGKVVDTFSTLVNPGCSIPAEASAVNGISDDDVDGAPEYSDIANTVASYILGSVVVGHNVTFDLRFVDCLLKECGYTGKCTYIDTLSISRRMHQNLPNHKLQTLIEHFGIEQQQAHRGFSDAEATLSLFRIFQAEFDAQLASEAARRKAAKERKEEN